MVDQPTAPAGPWPAEFLRGAEHIVALHDDHHAANISTDDPEFWERTRVPAGGRGPIVADPAAGSSPTPAPTGRIGAVHRYLITAPADRKMDFWAATGMFANWLEGRPNGDRETWLATVFDQQSASFLIAAAHVGVTVEEIEGSGDTETYRLLVGEPGTGWQGSEGQAAMERCSNPPEESCSDADCPVHGNYGDGDLDG